jgi:PIN domain nuclease of toxin-antitoxin system
LDAPLLLDTCALIYAVEDTISTSAADVMTNAIRVGLAVFVSPITAWEMGMLMRRGRYTSPVTANRWFAEALARPGMVLATMSPDLLIASSFLPGRPPKDPADRIIAATARDLGLTLVTRDRQLLDYAEQGHVDAIDC